ncbi:hypothetical protein D049_1228B, partial [Vibrio parahaemolyticus VPTS-2010]
HPK